MKNLLKNAWRYRPFWHPLKRFGGEAYDSVENIHWTLSEAVRRGRSTVRRGENRGASLLKIINSFSDEDCRQHYLKKPRLELRIDYVFYAFAFAFSFVVLIASLTYSFSPAATQTVATLLVGPTGIILSSIYMALMSWRCWQCRVGGNYPPHRFIAAVLRNPLNIFP